MNKAEAFYKSATKFMIAVPLVILGSFLMSLTLKAIIGLMFILWANNITLPGDDK